MGAFTHPVDMSSKGTITIRPRKLLTNRLLQRRQMVLDVHHPSQATPDKATLTKMICEYLSKAKGHKADAGATTIFGLKTCFGGGKSTYFALVYDNKEAAMKNESNYRLARAGMAESKARTGRKQRKEKKNREKKFRGTRKEKRVRNKDA